MEIKAKEVSEGVAGKKYNREVFWCNKDDVWIHIEIPFGSAKYA